LFSVQSKSASGGESLWWAFTYCPTTAKYSSTADWAAWTWLRARSVRADSRILTPLTATMVSRSEMIATTIMISTREKPARSAARRGSGFNAER